MALSALCLKWLTTALFLAAGLILALNLPFSVLGFFLFLTGHLILIAVFLQAKDWPLVSQNLMFCTIDLIGIYRWL